MHDVVPKVGSNHPIKYTITKAAYPTIGIAALVMFGIVYFIG